MREILPSQLPLVAPVYQHLHTRELVEMSRILDGIPEAAGYVHEDLVRGVAHPEKGRPGMSAEQVLRIALIKQMTGFSYEQLAFHLGDSMSYRAFCKFGLADRPPTDSTLKRNLKRLQPETLEKVYRLG
ncbi:MAG: transposase [Deltaproteobacteria bacterium]|nr:transposase [Deltaproteobacteria bacterium]